NFNGVTGAEISSRLNVVKPLNVTDKASGVSIHTNAENEIDQILKAGHDAGGRLVSIQPVRQSLEELFVKGDSDQG
ncbi:MAG TPA: hypothetical protein VGJ02_08665, partial [Pyrinomonadaceae bacterium]